MKKANYIKREESKKIFIVNSSELTEQEKAEIKLYVELMGYTVEISRVKPKKEPKKGYSKLEIIYYLEKTAPEAQVKEFIKRADDNFMKGYQWFKDYYKKQNPNDKDEKGKVKEYAGQAYDLIQANEEEAKKRIKELEKEEEEKKKAKKAKKK